MSGSDAENAASQQSSRSATPWARLRHWLCVTSGFRSDPHHEAIRARTLAASVAILFALSGAIRHFSWADLLADSPFEMDMAYRAVANGWFESSRTLPVTVVDIDAETYRGWGTPPITPRDRLTQMLEVVTGANPAAVVVDIDLSWGETGQERPDAGSLLLRGFLEQYRGAALLVFPKRIEPAADGGRRMFASPLDDVVARNEHLAWAHASFQTGRGGAVRGWQDWLAVCTPSGMTWLPSVATSVLMAIRPKGIDRPVAPDVRQSCATADEPVQETRRLLIGPGLTVNQQGAPRRDAQMVSASLLLDPDVARNDAQLFGRRVVFIGATHPSAGDFWLTPSGVVPGVELLASTVRFAPLQRTTQNARTRFAYRAISLVLFVIFVYFERKLRGPLAYAVTTFCVLGIVAMVLAVFDDLGVFEAMEAAILLVILYKALDIVLSLVAEIRTRRAEFAAGRHGWRQTLVAMCRRA